MSSVRVVSTESATDQAFSTIFHTASQSGNNVKGPWNKPQRQRLVGEPYTVSREDLCRESP